MAGIHLWGGNGRGKSSQEAFQNTRSSEEGETEGVCPEKGRQKDRCKGGVVERRVGWAHEVIMPLLRSDKQYNAATC